MKINGKVISEPKSKLTIKNDPYLTFKMKFNKNKWDIKFMSIVCFDSLAKEVKWNIDKNDLIRITLDKNFEITNETLFIKPNNIELRKKKLASKWIALLATLSILGGIGLAAGLWVLIARIKSKKIK